MGSRSSERNIERSQPALETGTVLRPIWGFAARLVRIARVWRRSKLVGLLETGLFLKPLSRPNPPSPPAFAHCQPAISFSELRPDGPAFATFGCFG